MKKNIYIYIYIHPTEFLLLRLEGLEISFKSTEV